MTGNDSSSTGADLARIALRQAKEAARRRGTTPAKPKRTFGRAHGNGRDVLRLGAVMTRMTIDNGWQSEAEGGSLVDRWASIVGEERAVHWRAVTYTAATRTLELACDSDAWATMLGLAQQKLIADVNLATSPGTLAAIRVRRAKPKDEPGARPARSTSPDRNTIPAAPGQPAPWTNEYATTRDALRQAKVARDAAAGSRPGRIAVTLRIQERQDAPPSTTRLTDDPERTVSAIRAADTHRKALLTARAQRAGLPAPLQPSGNTTS
ncbi:DciA family protein [Streptomyces sp. NPDC001584]|uniref:DciA family protein n=1 Tax=Streptomyces sp. NPDC001584 TaxID=3154521 RepID=UPI003324383F